MLIRFFCISPTGDAVFFWTHLDIYGLHAKHSDYYTSIVIRNYYEKLGWFKFNFNHSTGGAGM